MEVEIIITIEVNKEDFDKYELRSDILSGFEERTGYEVQQLNIDTQDD